MESYLVDTKDEIQLAEVVAAYWELSSPDLLCAAGFDGPDVAAIKRSKFQPILCKDKGKVVGVMCIKVKTKGIYYPAMKRNRVAVLRSMVECAQENYNSLSASTDNQYIHELASQIGLSMNREDNTLTWSKNA